MIFGCSKVSEPIKKIGIGTDIISYDSDNKGQSLVIPPKLTSPLTKGIFATSPEKIDKEVFQKSNNIDLKRDRYRRWLVVNLSPNETLELSKEFLRSFGFIIDDNNLNIGIIETDYLEKETIVPEKSLGPIRAALAKALKTSYGMPTADKYRIRIEPLEDPNKSEVYLTLSSIGEVVSGQMRLWQPKDKDLELETQMLLSLMVFLGSDEAEASNKLKDFDQKNVNFLEVITSDSGYANLVLPYNRIDSWRYLGWALDELSVDVEDRDISDGSFYIKVSPNKGFFSNLISSAGSIKTYQLYVKQIDNSQSVVYFVDLTEENSNSSINYSFELFNNILDKF